MRESDMRQIVVKTLQGLDAISVENPARPGTPDVNYVEGWIELKYLPSWPVRAGTEVKIKCFTPQQRVWLSRRCRRGGSAFFLVRVADDWLLFDGTTAAELLGRITKQEMFNRSILHCYKTLRTNDLIKVLKTWSANTDD